MKPTLEQVKEYFKNAKEVRCLEGELIDLTLDIYDERGIHKWGCSYYICLMKIKNFTLVNEEGKYAEIISYKENPIHIFDFNEHTKSKEIIVKDAEIVKETYDLINPNHYKNSSKEVIDMMLDIWGAEKLIAHCEMCAFKYRMRIGSKPNQLIENDLQKAQWYENKAKSLRDETM